MTLQGVNLGGWLLLEKGPSYPLFESCKSAAEDEHSLCRELSSNGTLETILNYHRESFITENDFQQMSMLQVNSVRLPFGYWLIEPLEGDGFYKGKGLFYYVDKVVEWCNKYKIKVLLDLHGAPGGESNGPPCGRSNHLWKTSDWLYGHSVRILEIIGKRYKDTDCVLGLQICNEPHPSIPMDTLYSFYMKCSTRLRQVGFDKKIILPVFTEWRLNDFVSIFKTTDHDHSNLVIDLHFYHCFGEEFSRMSYDQHKHLMQIHRNHITGLQDLGLQVFVGEWSCAIDSSISHTTFFHDQLSIYNSANGHFFWNWRDGNHGWSFLNYVYSL